VRTDHRPGTELPPVFPVLRPGKLRQVRVRDLAVRFALGAVISVAAAIIGKAAGPQFGGGFLAFPAILPASLTLIQEEEGTRRADRNALGAVLGGVGMVVFAITGELCFGRVEPFGALALAVLAWAATSFALYALLAFLRPDSCDRTKD
jgi:Protein of unknown function (DUF3147)